MNGSVPSGVEGPFFQELSSPWLRIVMHRCSTHIADFRRGVITHTELDRRGIGRGAWKRGLGTQLVCAVILPATVSYTAELLDPRIDHRQTVPEPKSALFAPWLRDSR